MARTGGITYQDVANAAQSLTARDLNPTIGAIRRELGDTGSSSTIAAHLKTWKIKQNETHSLIGKEKLPDELVATIKGLWIQMAEEANSQIEKIKLQAEIEISKLNEGLQKNKEESLTLEKQLNQLQQLYNTITQDKLSLEQAVTALQKEVALLNATNEALSKQILEKQDRVQELHKLLTQAQQNLEHYRESTREQRVLEQQRFEQQKQQLENTIAHLQQKLMTYSNEKLSLQQQYDKLIFENESQAEELKKERIRIIKIETDLSTSEKSRIETNQAMLHWEKQSQLLYQKNEQQTLSMLDLQKEAAIFSEQILSLKKQLVELNDQNKQLALKNWEISQEKSQFEGQLKQLQLIMKKNIRFESIA